MFSVPVRCAECAAEFDQFQLLALGVCALCGRMVCRRHFVRRKGIATCAACVPRRALIESTGPIADRDEAQVVALLTRDLAATVGDACEDAVVEAAARIRLSAQDDLDSYLHRVVDEVQQYVHDAFIDTTWPACPWHANHPLWHADGWRCERTGRVVAALGSLPRRAANHDQDAKPHMDIHRGFIRAAYQQALTSYNEGGLPIGAVMVEHGAIVAAGHNRRVQDGDPTAHGEMDCLRRAGRRARYGGVTLYTTLSPCMMCAGTVLQFGIPTVVVGEDRSFPGNLPFLRDHGVEVVLLDDPECLALMERFIRERPDLWDEDIAGRTHV